MTSRENRLRRHIELGLLKHRNGQIDAAAAEYRQALAIAPRNPQALHLLGTSELQLGYTQDAAKHLEQAAKANGNHPGILGNLAQAYFALHRFADAHAAFRKASQLDPRQVGFRVGTANALAMQGKLAEAETALRQIVEHHPREFLPWFNLGNVLRDQHRHADAVDCYQRSIELEPRFADTHNNLGTALHTLNRFDEAEQSYRACLALDPEHAQARFNLASVTIDAGKFAEAESVCRTMVARAPQDPVGYKLLGVALSNRGRVREALVYHRQAATLAPDEAKAAETLAGALASVGEIDAALREFERALALDPESASVPNSRAGALLAAGRFLPGWADYSHRAASRILREKHAQLQTATILPAELRGSTLLLLREQGLGDELFFLRYAPLLSAAGATLTYRASSKLKSLLERVDCLALILDESSVPPPADATLLIGDLPYALNEYAMSRRDDSTADASTACPQTPAPLVLTPQPVRLDAIRHRLRQAGNPPYVGLSWRGGVPPSEQTGSDWNLFKSIDPAALGEALRTTHGTVLTLQRRPLASEIERCSAALGRDLHDFSDLNEDLEGMLALLALIDEYVGVSNTNMHLRAGVGRHARVLVPQPAEWRWMTSGQSSPWFPGFSVYRQGQDGDWSDALAALARDLRVLAACRTFISGKLLDAKPPHY